MVCNKRVRLGGAFPPNLIAAEWDHALLGGLEDRQRAREGAKLLAACLRH